MAVVVAASGFALTRLRLHPTGRPARPARNQYLGLFVDPGEVFVPLFAHERACIAFTRLIVKG
jgi:hypothetical protein